ncbi:MAG: multidrug efflux SMR transporter [Paracoccus sp. (in: a-proteobacteria)]|nr:multidrug efflux SMR transporter [Paracoccus sp. (in: a-proteobacteria)]
MQRRDAMPPLTAYLLLLVSVGAELAGTTFLQKSEQFTRALPTLLMVLCYGLSFYLLTHVLRFIPLGVAYALWAGIGIVSVAIIGRVVFGQVIDLAGIIGIGMIVSGVVVLNLFSRSVGH